MAVIWRALPLASPFLVAAVPVVSLWAANRVEFSIAALLPILALTSLLAAVLLALGRAVTGRWVAGAVVASTAAAAIVGYGMLVDAVAVATSPERAEDLGSLVAWATVVGGVVAIVAVTVLARRGRFVGADAARAISVAAVGFMLVGLLRPPDPGAHADGGGESGAVIHGADPAETSASPIAVDGVAPAGRLPDVYFVILDGYTRDDVLDEVYGFDNQPFLAELEQRGFYVARDSYANYPATYLSLAATLNERYLTPELAAGRPYEEYVDMIQRAEVPEAFKRLGYRYVLVRSVWEGTARSPLADELRGLGAAFGSELAASVVGRSLVGPLVPEGTVADSHLAAFDALDTMPGEDVPTFTVAHVIVPHPPYVLDHEGNVVSEVTALRGSWAGDENRRGYLEQLRFANDRLLEVVDGILARSTTPPIIVVQGDHGVFGASFEVDEDRRAAAARLAILNAMLVPDDMRTSLYPSISPVNAFRVILSRLTGQDPALLDDRSFYYEGKRPGPFVEVAPRFAP